MRTTLTLDEDVAAKLAAEAGRSVRSFRDVVNDTLRRGLASRRELQRQRPFTVVARDLGHLRPGLTLDSVADLIDHVGGALHR